MDSLSRTAFPMEGTWRFHGGGRPEASSVVPRPYRQGPRGAYDRLSTDIHHREPVDDGGGDPSRRQLSSMAPRETVSKARRMSQLEEYRGMLISSACSRVLMNCRSAVSVEPGRKPCYASERT